jgi:hypothetical protein
MTHNAVRAIASSEPVRMDGLFAAIRVAKRRLDAVGLNGERRGLRTAFDKTPAR